jgi:tail assembly protein
MSKFNTDTLAQKAKEKFEDLEVELSETESVLFQHALRLSKAERKKILDLVDQVTQDDDDEEKSSDATERLEKAYTDVLTAVAADKAKARAFLKKLDVPQLTVLFEEWLAGTKLGEASSSQS